MRGTGENSVRFNHTVGSKGKGADKGVCKKRKETLTRGKPGDPTQKSTLQTPRRHRLCTARNKGKGHQMLRLSYTTNQKQNQKRQISYGKRETVQYKKQPPRNVPCSSRLRGVPDKPSTCTIHSARFEAFFEHASKQPAVPRLGQQHCKMTTATITNKYL